MWEERDLEMLHVISFISTRVSVLVLAFYFNLDCSLILLFSQRQHIISVLLLLWIANDHHLIAKKRFSVQWFHPQTASMKISIDATICKLVMRPLYGPYWKQVILIAITCQHVVWIDINCRSRSQHCSKAADMTHSRWVCIDNQQESLW